MESEESGSNELGELEASLGNEQAEVRKSPEETIQEMEQLLAGDLPAQTQVQPAEELEQDEGDEEEEVAEDEQDEGEEEDPEDEDLNPQEKKHFSTRAQKRIKNLVAAKKALSQDVQSLRNEFSQSQQYAQQQLAQMQHQTAKQMEMLYMQNRQLQQQLARAGEKPESELTPAEQFRRDVLAEARKEWEAQHKRELAPLKQQLQRTRAQEQERLRLDKQQRLHQHYTNQAREVLQTRVLDGYDPETQKELYGPTEEILIAMASAFGKEPGEIAEDFVAWKKRFVAAELKKMGKRNKAKFEKSKLAPKPVSSARKPGQASSQTRWPTMAQLEAANMEDHTDWIHAGQPHLPAIGE